jgi:uncharacterized peroxidase-related enzyme
MFKSLFTSLKNAKSIVDIFDENQKKYMPSLVLAEEVLREPSHLSPAERELIAAFTSRLNKCDFCADSHIAFTKEQGISLEEITKVLRGDYFGHRLQFVFDYVRKLTLDPTSLTDGDFRAVIDSGITEDELKDAIAVCAAFNYFNRIVEGHFLPTDPNGVDGFERVAEMITKYGYDRRRMNA